MLEDSAKNPTTMPSTQKSMSLSNDLLDQGSSLWVHLGEISQLSQVFRWIDHRELQLEKLLDGVPRLTLTGMISCSSRDFMVPPYWCRLLRPHVPRGYCWLWLLWWWSRGTTTTIPWPSLMWPSRRLAVVEVAPGKESTPCWMAVSLN